MTDNTYPVYAVGQTLTAEELNLTTFFLKRRDQLLGRAIGFGVNCGLGGTIVAANPGEKLVIGAGLAVDQAGEVLALPAGQDVALPPVESPESAPPTTPFSFIDAALDGFSIVLEATETAPPPQPCTQAGCGGHPSMHATDVAVRVVKGQITGIYLDFASETLLGVQPMRLSVDSDPIGGFVTLRNTIATRLSNAGQPRIAAGLVAKLQGVSIGAGDLAGVKGYACGWLNMVLFASLDLLRCEGLYDLACDRMSARNGVVLGWVHQAGGDWVFDCAHRHAWEPPRGFTEAFLGGTCSDPCKLYRDRLEGLIASYAPPDPPLPGGGGPGPKVDYCSHVELTKGKCWPIYYPPKEVPDDWHYHWEDPVLIDPKTPVWRPPEEFDPSVIYQYDGYDHYADGFLHGGGLLGYSVQEASQVLTATGAGTGVTPNVVIKQAGEVSALSGYAPSEGWSPSDTMVLVVGADNTVIATGRVSALQTSREISTALPTAVAAAQRATTAADGIEATVSGFEAKVGTFDQQMKTYSEGLDSLTGEFAVYSGGKFDQPSIEHRLSDLETSLQKVATFGDRVSKLEGSVGVLSGLQKVGIRSTYDTGVARGISAFAKTTVVAMKSLGQVEDKNFQLYTASAERAQAELDLAVAAEDPAAITVATLGVLDTVRTMVKASGADAGTGRELDAQMRDLQGLIG